MKGRRVVRGFLAVLQYLCLLGLALLVVRFNKYVADLGVGRFAILLYFLVSSIFLQPIVYAVMHRREKSFISLLSEAYAASSLPLASLLLYKFKSKGYYFSWILLVFVMLPFAVYKKWLNNDFLMYVPLGVLAALVVYAQVVTIFEFTVGLIRERKS